MDDWRLRIDVTEWEVSDVEASGSHVTQWLVQPGTPDREAAVWLHKSTVTPANGIEQGEDWAEVVSTQVGSALGVPCAITRMCMREGVRGSISRSVRPAGYALWEGWFALEVAEAPGYFRHEEGDPGVDPSRPDVRRPGHSIANIRHSLEGYLPPLDFAGPDWFGAFDVFVGYLLLDALIANRDRHESNWAILLPELRGPEPRLAPSYDHASSLGFNLTDDRRLTLLDEPARLMKWVENGTAYRFEHVERPASLVDHAVAALATCTATVREWWAERVRTVDLTAVFDALAAEASGPVSHPASTVAAAILKMNLGRLNDALAAST